IVVERRQTGDGCQRAHHAELRLQVELDRAFDEADRFAQRVAQAVVRQDRQVELLQPALVLLRVRLELTEARAQLGFGDRERGKQPWQHEPWVFVAQRSLRCRLPEQIVQPAALRGKALADRQRQSARVEAELSVRWLDELVAASERTLRLLEQGSHDVFYDLLDERQADLAGQPRAVPDR